MLPMGLWNGTELFTGLSRSLLARSSIELIFRKLEEAEHILMQELNPLVSFQFLIMRVLSLSVGSVHQ